MPMHPEEFTTIKVNMASYRDAIEVSPQEEAGKLVFQQILDHAPQTLEVNSGGMEGTDERHITGAYLFFGGKHYRRREGNLITQDYDGAIKVHLDLSAVDYRSASQLRGFLWYGTMFDPSVEQIAERFRFVRTPLCGTCGIVRLRTSLQIETKTCEYCSSRQDSAL